MAEPKPHKHASGFRKEDLNDYARFVEAMAIERAKVQGPKWPGSQREADFFIGAMLVYVFMHQNALVPPHWIEAIGFKGDSGGSVVVPGKTKG